MERAAGLQLDMDLARDLSPAQSRAALAPLFASTRYSLCNTSGRVTLDGPWREYLRVDPELANYCNRYGLSPDQMEVRSTGNLDLCLGDGATGLHLSRLLFGDPEGRDLILLHLDDHADLMPTLLVKHPNGRLHDPETKAGFDSTMESHWRDALARGTISIGNYLTPLFHVLPPGRKIHVRHLRPTLDPDFGSGVQPVSATTTPCPLLGGLRFASLTPGDAATMPVGSYRQGKTIGPLLEQLPPGRIVVHIDLDVFVNDYNGMPGRAPETLAPARQREIRSRMAQFFTGLHELARPVERWIIATSPGFCAARHWTWLLQELGSRISAFAGETREVSLE